MSLRRERPREHGLRGFSLDVVGIGALNLDYIASANSLSTQPTSLAARVSSSVADSTPLFEWGAETLVEEQTIYDELERVSAASLDVSLGGSSFNAIFALARMQIGIRLGYVGVAGRVLIPGLSSLQQFDVLGVDRTLVRSDESRPCGICLSFLDGGERTLLTHAGANAEMAAFIDTEFDRLVDYLSSARVLHVTSFLDPETPKQLLKLLQKVKECSPRTLISFDPGHPWAVAPTPAVEGILRISDFLLVNYREFKALGEYANRDTDETVAARLLQRLKSRDGVLIVKRNDGVLSFRMENEFITQEHFAHMPLPTEEIRDATGAGDIFAAGLLAVITGHQFQVELGSLLGMSLARHKLRYVGTQGHTHFPEITRSFIRSRDAERRRIALPQGVFIGHGGDPQWRSLKAFLEEECHLPVFAFESDPWGSKQVTEALTKYLDQCSFAVCVLTAEDPTQDGRRRARQNVIHEAGLFQGRYGYERVLLLVEEGCEMELNTTDLPSISFPKNGIESTFWRLQKMIRRQGFTGSSA